jgi:hypothetical protein
MVAAFKSMEEAENDVPKSTRERLGKKLIPIGDVSIKLNKEISKVLAKEINAKKQNIRLKDVKHIDEVHGVGRENNPSQIPVTKDMFMLVPDVLENFDDVKKGSETVGRESVRVSKNYSDGKAIIANAVLEDGNLSITSMYVKSPTAVRPRAAEALPDSRLSN